MQRCVLWPIPLLQIAVLYANCVHGWFKDVLIESTAPCFSNLFLPFVSFKYPLRFPSSLPNWRNYHEFTQLRLFVLQCVSNPRLSKACPKPMFFWVVVMASLSWWFYKHHSSIFICVYLLYEHLYMLIVYSSRHHNLQKLWMRIFVVIMQGTYKLENYIVCIYKLLFWSLCLFLGSNLFP